jgi:hypothetical protein
MYKTSENIMAELKDDEQRRIRNELIPLRYVVAARDYVGSLVWGAIFKNSGTKYYAGFVGKDGNSLESICESSLSKLSASIYEHAITNWKVEPSGAFESTPVSSNGIRFEASDVQPTLQIFNYAPLPQCDAVIVPYKQTLEVRATTKQRPLNEREFSNLCKYLVKQGDKVMMGSLYRAIGSL